MNSMDDLQMNFGPWTLKEQEKYIVFLESFRKELQSKKKRK